MSSSLLVPPRSYEPEIMDGTSHDAAEIARALRDLARVNRWLGGVASLWRPLKRIIDERGIGSFTLLDVGTGGGDVPRSVVVRAARAGIAARAVGIDADPATIAYAARQPAAKSVAYVRADAFSLPFSDRSFDFVTSSMMFHHFRESEAARILLELSRVARRAVLVNDLARHRVPWATIRILALIAESRMVRHDAPLSVLRGWTSRELMGVAAEAGLGARARVERLFPYRLILVVETA